MKNSRSRSSGIELRSSSSAPSALTARLSSLQLAQLLARSGARGAARSIARLRAVRTIQAPGLSGSAVARPALERDHERVLDRLLGEVEVAEDADQGRDRPSRLAPEQAVDDLCGPAYARRLRGAASAASDPRPRSP